MVSELIVVERDFDEPMSMEQIEAIFRDASGCFGFCGIRYIRGYLSSDGRRMICTYAAKDAESVRQMNRQTQVPFSRIWPAGLFESGQLDDASRAASGHGGDRD